MSSGALEINGKYEVVHDGEILGILDECDPGEYLFVSSESGGNIFTPQILRCIADKIDALEEVGVIGENRNE